MSIIGAFVSTAGGLAKTLDRADALGVDSIMMFASSPQSWKRRVFDPSDVRAFRERFASSGYQSLWIHGTYLMNFGSQNSAALAQSTEALICEIQDAAQLGAKGVIFHLGSHKGNGLASVTTQVADALKMALQKTPGGPWVVLENAAGQGGAIGRNFVELGAIIRAAGSDQRLKICLDTQHAFAAGYAVQTADGLAEALREFNQAIGLDRLVALHANDSKKPLGSGVDRHENIGLGLIGDAGWQVLTHDPTLRQLPFLLEVPGLEGHGPDKPNVDRLRAIAASS